MTTGTKTKSPVSFDEAKTIYDKIVKEKTSKGYSENRKWRNQVMVEYGQFYVQPKQPQETCFEDFRDDELNQRFESFPQHATIFIDEEAWMIYVDSEIASDATGLEDAVQAMCLPIDVTDDHGLFLRSVNDKDDEDGIHCKVSITFLPRGTIGTKVLKGNWFALPSKLVIHTPDGGIQELPSSAI